LYNLTRLFDSGSVQDRLSILTADPARENVARLVTIKLPQIYELVTDFSDVASKAAFEELLDFTALTKRCEEFLLGLGFSCPARDKGEVGGAHIWRFAAHTLDLAIVLYAGAHMAELNARFGDDEPLLPIHVPGPFADARLNRGIEQGEIGRWSSVVFKCKLLCLDGYLRSDVWVFHPASDADIQTSLEQEPLHLATDAATLSDIWGPLWEEREQKSQQSPLLAYELGDGRIFPWPPTTGVNVMPGEVYCHWLANNEENPSAKPVAFFSGTNQLLIGAPPTLRIDARCSDAPDQQTKLMARFRLASRLMPVEATGDRDVLDSRNDEVNASITTWKFLTLGFKRGRSYKHLKGQSWIASLTAEWDPAKMLGNGDTLDVSMEFKYRHAQKMHGESR